MDVISIGVQSGGPEAEYIGKIKVHLYQALRDSCNSTHCDDLDEYAPILRIDGAFAQFGDEGITRLRFAKKQRYITADIQIPESVWRPKDRNQIKDYLAQKVRECIQVFVQRLKKDNVTVDELTLFSEIDNGIAHFLSVDYNSQKAEQE